MMNNVLLVELGGGTNPHPRADIIIDLHHPKESPAQDAAVTPWFVNARSKHAFGWADGRYRIAAEVADKVYCSHFLEHIPAGQSRLNVFNEAWRILKPGGTFEIIVPCIGYTDHANGGGPVHTGWQGWADPTHVSQWWYPESFWYFDGTYAANADYGNKPWKSGSSELVNGWEAHVVLVKP